MAERVATAVPAVITTPGNSQNAAGIQTRRVLFLALPPRYFGKIRNLMFGFFHRRQRTVNTQVLGPLETQVMDKLWQGGPGNVRDVMVRLDRNLLAYTTVMTTLNRLCAKGLLYRQKSGPAFVYTPRCTRQEWDQASAEDFLAAYLGESRPRIDLLISFLIDAAGTEDPSLLDEMEHRINAKRAELREREKG